MNETQKIWFSKISKQNKANQIKQKIIHNFINLPEKSGQMQNQRKVKEQNDLLRKKMFVLTALEDKIKYLVKKLEELSDRTATTADSNTIIENYGSLVQQIRELLSIYNKVRANAEADSGEMVTPLKEQVDMLEKVILWIFLDLIIWQ